MSVGRINGRHELHLRLVFGQLDDMFLYEVRAYGERTKSDQNHTKSDTVAGTFL